MVGSGAYGPLNTKSKTQKKHDAWCNGINN